MDNSIEAKPVGIVGKALALFSVAAFWLIPISALMSIAAVLSTRRAPGWPRTLARTGAILATVWTLLFAVPFVCLVTIAAIRGDWAF
jgi:hypothetical protein